MTYQIELLMQQSVLDGFAAEINNSFYISYFNLNTLYLRITVSPFTP